MDEIEKKFSSWPLQNALTIIKSNLSSGSQQIPLAGLIVRALEQLHSKRELFCENCPDTITEYGDSFNSSISGLTITSDRYRAIAGYLLAFYEELSLKYDYKLFEEANFGGVRSELISNFAPSQPIDSINLVLEELRNKLLRKRLTEPAFMEVMKLASSQKLFDNRMEALATSLNQIDEKLDVFEGRIANVRKGNNFVELNGGFESLLNTKKVELKETQTFVYGLSALLVFFPLVFLVAHAWVGPENLVAFGLPMLSVELFLLYCFRLKYSESKSISAQMLQLQLRMTLCQFIEAYSEYTKSMHKETPELIARFESLIFSPIVANESDIPPVLDGVQQIVDLFKSKGGS